MIEYSVLRQMLEAEPTCALHLHYASDPKLAGDEAFLKDQRAADALNASGRYREVVPCPIGVGTLLDVLGPQAGSQVLDSLSAAATDNRPIFWAMRLLERGELDLGRESTRASVRALVGVLLTSEQADLLLAKAERPVVVTAADVSIALRNLGG